MTVACAGNPLNPEEMRVALQAIERHGGKVMLCPLLDQQGLRVKQVGPHFIDVVRMAFNWRIVETYVANPLYYARYWCYAGTAHGTFLAAVLAAAVWDGAADTEPLSWNKNGQTGQWREPALKAALCPCGGQADGAAQTGMCLWCNLFDTRTEALR
ncbi:hypothetical protein JNUCC0626_20145 [Lentzea sp. JNUCC 0626]|uniref:hypothetical protein n=1 Tax=Lentzea sp. JNUCC 0626 TaxID=3367513 RepID=UPI003747E322